MFFFWFWNEGLSQVFKVGQNLVSWFQILDTNNYVLFPYNSKTIFEIELLKTEKLNLLVALSAKYCKPSHRSYCSILGILHH